MPKTFTQRQLDKLLAEERAKVRKAERAKKPDVHALVKEAKAKVDSKHRDMRFTKRTGSCYRGMKNRASESKVKLKFTCEDLRKLVSAAIGTQCPYGGGKITIATFAVDHNVPIARGGSWELSNLVVSTATGNHRKGQLTGKEWIKFDTSLRKHFHPDACTDIFRRLTLGGKWSFGR